MIFSFFYSLFLYFYSINFLDISSIDLKTINSNSFISYLYNYIFDIFGRNQYSLRIISVLAYFISSILFYFISLKLLSKQDAFKSLVIFSLLPGVISASMIANESIFLILLTNLYLYLFFYFRKISYLFLFILAFVSKSFIIMFLALVFYSIYIKNTYFLIYSIILLMINGFYFNYYIGGKPHGYFIEFLSMYIAIFSPFVFIFFVYVVYRTLIKEKKNIIFFISFVSFLFALLLSFRQKIYIDEFGPFSVVSVILFFIVFYSSYKVRIKPFRKKYKLIYSFLFFSLLLYDVLLFYNKPLYLILDNPKKHFLYDFSFSKELSNKLKKDHINNIKCSNKILCQKLKFYGIDLGEEYLISTKYKKDSKKYIFMAYNKPIASFYVSKINK